MNYRLIAIQVGDLLKNVTTVTCINQVARSVFNFSCEAFPNKSITSKSAQLIHDWILSLAKQEMNNVERNKELLEFVDLIIPEFPRLYYNERINRKIYYKEKINEILKKAGLDIKSETESNKDFYDRNFHEEIHKHCSKLYAQGNYFHAVFEAAKVYNKKVHEKAQSNDDGEKLMMEAWNPNGVLKITACKTKTDKNVQEGIKFLSAGLMQALRNPTAHEPALDWPISKEDCLDLLSFISYLLRQLDKAAYYKNDNI
ncbi:TIGR02391 family protein [Thermosipho sp. (in: thermotogales)]|jgi:uncharacterized protein (TIGR02391 family)|uniref:TIGR02391 family protein n=1 Tax=Thermosipho sp. (in: thermotogales) TaxID=1968895 RepID=UPI0025806F2A|nr:TIGR02391 family protein [Thermosipho sp. (in: thermotogales)]MBZ4651119.1 hypothetical protein [Thermosipho sp. (in: thermotogales)]